MQSPKFNPGQRVTVKGVQCCVLGEVLRVLIGAGPEGVHLYVVETIDALWVAWNQHWCTETHYIVVPEEALYAIT